MTTRVLIIDDDVCACAVIASTLSRLGYETDTAHNGRAGLDLFAVEPADLVITDIFMPQMDGIETLLALRENIIIPKIIAISGGGVMCGMEVLRVAELLGADAVLPKPLSMSNLCRVVGDLLDRGGATARPGAIFGRNAA